MQTHSTTQAAKTDPDQLLTYAETARLLDLSQRTIWALVNRGEIPSLHIGRSVRIRRRALIAWIERRERKGA